MPVYGLRVFYCVNAAENITTCDLSTSCCVALSLLHSVELEHLFSCIKSKFYYYYFVCTYGIVKEGEGGYKQKLKPKEIPERLKQSSAVNCVGKSAMNGDLVRWINIDKRYYYYYYYCCCLLLRHEGST